ncbi:pyridoxine 5'-phosphate synthase [uncultured Abyssibacter sp.]|uniref:pyridoxine 5'-phosphate synthase n=1 Tax=uncultured Abyssibacter sp. TaxID=2320202 RepID=UPI0032B10FD3
MSHPPIRLGVNVDHVATIRQARGTVYPDPAEAGLLAAHAGADGVTVHLREDRRHIQERDVRSLAAQLNVPLNLEMSLADDMLDFAVAVAPPHCCLVPERREELTTEGGLDVAGQTDRVRRAVERLAGAGVRVSLFIDPDERQLEAAVAVGAPAVEIHTGEYADHPERMDELAARIRNFAREASAAGLEVHAGHGLHLDNVGPIAAIGEIVELNIGHFLVARALFVGLPAAVNEMKQRMVAARG